MSIVETSDPLKKREEYAVSLRKKKKQEILQESRKRFMGGPTA